MKKQKTHTTNILFGNTKKKTYNQIVIIIFIAIFILIYLLNKKTLLYADDWVYSAIFGVKEYTPVKSLLDIIKSQYNHYFIWGGRSVVHFIDQLMLLSNHNLLSILKSLCFTFLAYMIYRYSYNNQKEHNVFLLIFEIALVYSFYINFEEVMLWTTGAANYLFGTTIVVLFIYPFYTYYIGISNKKYNTMLFFIFGIIAGWTNENTGVALVFILIVLLCYEYKTKSKMPKWIVWGSIGVFTGYLIMVLAPGNYVRLSIEFDIADKSKTSKFEMILFGLKNVMAYYTRYYQLVTLCIIYLVGFVYMFFIKKRDSIFNKKVQASILFFIAGNLSAFVMIVLPVFAPRATFSVITFFIIAIIIIYSELIKYKYFKCYFYCLLLTISCFAFRKYYFIYAKTDLLYIKVKKRDEYIKSQKKHNNLDIILPDNQLPISVYYLDFSTDPTALLNKNFCKYSGLKSIRIAEKKEARDIHE